HGRLRRRPRRRRRSWPRPPGPRRWPARGPAWWRPAGGARGRGGGRRGTWRGGWIGRVPAACGGLPWGSTGMVYCCNSVATVPDVMASSWKLNRADRIGAAASVLCAVHCALLPLALAALPALGLSVGGWADIDQAFTVFATLLGATTLAIGFRRHRTFQAWMLLVPGLAMVWLGAFTALHDHGVAHAAVMTAGGLLIAAAHLLNLRLTHAAEAAAAR